MNATIRDLLTEIHLREELSKDAKAEEFVRDFVNSNNPKFEGKSKAERIKMALAAYYQSQQTKAPKKEEVVESAEYPFHSGESDFRTGTSINHDRYQITFKPASQSNVAKEGKVDYLKGMHPERKAIVDKEAGLKTPVGQVTHASVYDYRTGNTTNHHIFQTSGNSSMASISSLSNNKEHDNHREILKNALSQTPDRTTEQAPTETK